MRKKQLGKRILAMVMSAAVGLTTVVSGAGTMLSVSAASTYEGDYENLLVNPDFEESTAFSPAGGSHEGNWFVWQSVAKTTEDAYSGETSAKFTGSDSALEQDVTGLQTGATYVYTVWAKLSGESDSAVHTVGVKNYGGDELKQQVTSTDWEKIEIEFVYTSGTPRVYGYTSTYGGVDMYMDNASVTLKGDIKSAEITNGQLDIVFKDSYTGDVSADVVSASYFTDVDASVKELELTEKSVNGNALSLTFPAVAALAVDQTVTVDVVCGGMTITLDYVVAASGEDVVTAKMVDLKAEQGTKGTVTITLDEDPTVKPAVSDFTWEYKVGDDEFKTLDVSDFVYTAADKTVTASYNNIRGLADGEAEVVIKVTYNNESKTVSYMVDQADCNVYYVDSTNGNDENDGLTPETAIASIDKLNTITFAPGDQILFKNGETFVGCFKPMGSGTEGMPIQIGTYGDSETRPVLQPGEDWTVDYIMSANAMVTNVKVNYVIQFYNVEYWEVSGLEIFDPNSEAYLTKGSDKYIGDSANDVYRSGITVQAEDIGELEHIYIDDVIIHGFHGPGTNIGKTSGGITMNVITNQARNIELSVPTQINDIRVTNCEIYDVGRSGINFLTPWSFRNEAKWGPYNYGTKGYDYLPYEDFYMANNYIHDVDGDGTIIDNCSNAISEYNLVTRCCLRPATEGGGAAVGLFNWNSDDTIFQFNEVYDIRPGASASYASNDNQGIEIDALNDRTWVQYNYVHDNYGGFMMLCNVGDSYRSFDGIIRYNISQKDYAHPRQGFFDIYAANYGTECYNNTFYMTERTLNSAGKVFLFSTVSAYETMKFYNNIFYYDGETPVEANTFGDGAIDWQSNIFYGFSNLPANDNEGAPNISADPMLVNAGAGGTGEYPGDQVDLSCYYTKEGSPAIDAGVPVENNGGRDYFGNAVAGIPDIGAYESGSVAEKVVSSDYAVDQEAKTVEVNKVDEVTVGTLLDGLYGEDGISIVVKRNDAVLADAVMVKEGDVVEAVLGDKTLTYTVTVNTAGANVIPVSEMTATAGDWETGSSTEGGAELAIDENTGTMWHTDWYVGPNHDDHWIAFELSSEYMVDGLTYLPRQSGTNGIITAYEIYVSEDGVTWNKLTEGEWAGDSTEKAVSFDAVETKYVKLQTVEALGDQDIVFASAAEIRLTGYKDVVCTEHTTEVVGQADASCTGAGYTGDEVCTVCGEVVKEGTLIPSEGHKFGEWVTVKEPTATEEALKERTCDNCDEKESEVIDKLVVVNKFTDVTEDQYWFDSVMWAVAQGITDGTSDTTFSPWDNCTRGHVVTFLYRAMGCPEVTNKENPFVDVKEDAFYYDAVLWAVENGITDGTSATTFEPDKECTRGQIVTFLYRNAGNPQVDTTANPFTDVAADSYYLTSILWAVENGITDGTSDNEFSPNVVCNRGQAVTFLYRSANK